MQPDECLHEALLDAHRNNDCEKLVKLYTQVADAEHERQNVDSAFHYLTYAYIYALEADLPEQSELYARLKANGRV